MHPACRCRRRSSARPPRSGSISAASRQPTSFPELEFLREWLDRGYAGEMHYLHRSADRRAGCPRGPAVRAFGHRPGNGLQRRASLLQRIKRLRSRRHRALRLGRRLPPRHRKTAGSANVVAALARREWLRSARLRRHRAGAGAGLCAVRGDRLDWQEHLRHQRGARVLDVPVGRHQQPCARARFAGARPVRHLRALSRRLPDRRARRAARHGRDEVSVVSDDRAQGRDSGQGARGCCAPCLRLRHLPGRLSLESDAVNGSVFRWRLASKVRPRRPVADGIVAAKRR